jgi:hypothetical protein
MIMRWVLIACLFCSTSLEGQTPSGLCVEWGAAREVGQLDSRLIAEASGLAVSSRFSNRLYHVDDSSSTIFMTDEVGNWIQSVAITGPGATDVEDLSLGPCGQQDCLFIADIGDNPGRRDSIEVIVVEEVDAFPLQVSPRHRLRLRYPDGPEDAEALGVSSNGDIFVISRRLFPEQSQAHAELFRLSVELWQGSGPDEIHTLEHLASIEMRTLASTLPGRLVTAMDFSADDQRMLLLTYGDAFEIELGGLLGSSLVEGQDYVRAPLVTLRQQEAIAYLPEDDGFVYSTEGVPGSAPPVSAPIMRVDCIRTD